MRVHLILPSMLILATASLHVLRGEQPTPTADEVVATMFARDGARELASGGYAGNREYVLENHKFQKRAQMLVRVTCERNGTKHFEVMSEDGWKSANKRVLRQMLVTESDSSRPDTRPLNRITSDNYTFRMIEATRLDGRTAYVIEASPKREEKSLFRGRIWVDGEDFALARVEGEPAKNPSFWTRKVHFVQQYYKSGAFWFPMQTTSVTDAHLFGTTEVNIRYFDYRPVSNPPTVVPDYSMMEAHNANR